MKGTIISGNYAFNATGSTKASRRADKKISQLKNYPKIWTEASWIKMNTNRNSQNECDVQQFDFEGKK